MRSSEGLVLSQKNWGNLQLVVVAICSDDYTDGDDRPIKTKTKSHHTSDDSFTACLVSKTCWELGATVYKAGWQI